MGKKIINKTNVAVVVLAFFFTLNFFISTQVLAQINPPIPPPNNNSDSAKIDDIRDQTNIIRNLAQQISELAKKINQNTRASISVGGTDYTVFDEALIHAVVTENFNPVTDSFCDYQIFFPNRSLFRAGSLKFVPSSRGLYVDNFTVPNITGVYPMDLFCVKPVNETSSRRFFIQKPFNDLGFKNKSGTGQQILTFTSIEPDKAEVCFTERFNERISDYENGEFPEFRFLNNITEITGFFSQAGGSATYDLTYKFYRKDNGLVFLGSSTNTSIQVDTTIRRFNFPTKIIDFPFTSDAVLQVEVCAQKLSGGAVNLFYYFNSTAENSSFVVNSKKINATTLDFQIGSSSELNVKLIGGSQNFTIQSQINLTEITDKIDEHDFNMNLNFTELFARLTNHNNTLLSVNSSIFSKLFAIQDEIISVNNTLLSVNVTLADLISAVPSNVWSFSTRTLTAFGFLVDLTTASINAIINPISTNITSMNSTLPQSVWEFEPRNVSLAQNVTTVNVTNIVTNATVTNISDNALDDIAERIIQFLIALRHIQLPPPL